MDTMQGDDLQTGSVTAKHSPISSAHLWALHSRTTEKRSDRAGCTIGSVLCEEDTRKPDRLSIGRARSSERPVEGFGPRAARAVNSTEHQPARQNCGQLLKRNGTQGRLLRRRRAAQLFFDHAALCTYP